MINHIVRQLNIDLITEDNNPIIKWFNDLWNQLSIVETDVYHENGGEFVYYIMIEDRKKFIFLQDDKNDRFWCNYTHYWSILETKFNLNYDEIQAITKLLVDNALNNDVATPLWKHNPQLPMVDNALNNDVASPNGKHHQAIPHVDNALNNDIASPIRHVHTDSRLVDNALNNDIATPVMRNHSLKELVDNALNNDIATPVNLTTIGMSQVDNALNNDVTTPIRYGCYSIKKVDNTLNND